MNRIKPSLAIPIIIVLIILFSVIYVLLLPSEKSAAPSRLEKSEEKSTSKNNSNLAEKESSAIKGSYVEYENNIIATTSGEKLLFFHADWCPQCRELEADIKKGPIPDNTTIIKVDFDNSQDLRQKYGVTQQTTIIRVNDDGSPAKKFIAYNEPTLTAVISGTR